ncbi:XRE family transcriptional regulator [Cnuibacter physcomitrellae]|uniref:helix-turn-helix domain-containing protein n=1 Tax=Cnuibacter physcomitrellae TaxID=1619308 RepID=UPI0021758590|nr:XRE family transcriptional regulator [Cnuibacter physcomitrellae]MCS5497717.1 XRE family transcriptional regulator [Cnuibacter physcomitrellae]
MEDPDRGRQQVDYGSRIRALRRQRRMTLQQVASAVGISASALSQIERGVSLPSVQRLPLIAQALGARLGELFASEDEISGSEQIVVRRASDPALMSMSSGVTYRRLTAAPIPDIDLFESIWEPLAASGQPGEFMSHPGFEGGTVSQGTLELRFRDRTVTLDEGDSITFDSALPHHLSNPSPHRFATATWVLHRHGAIPPGHSAPPPD